MASTLLQNVQHYFNRAADKLGLDETIRKVLSEADRLVVVNIPMRVNGELKVFQAYRVQHNNARGRTRRPSLSPQRRVG